MGSLISLVGPLMQSSGPTAPRIVSALAVRTYVDRPFSYRIAARGRPTSYDATGLPAGLSINTATGVISGTPTAIAVTNITISATNSEGTDTATLVLTVVAAPGPVVTPPWEMTTSLPGTVVVIDGTMGAGKWPLTALTGWDPAFAADLNDQALYLGPNRPTSPANQKIRLFATFTPPGTELEVDFDLFGLGTPAINKIHVWGFDSGTVSGDPPSIYIQGSNSTGNPVQIRIEKA